MPFIQDILKYKSVSIVGMAKNTGKTTCLNYVLNRLEEENCKVAVTSIGVDGEERDVLYDTLKPRIYLKKGNYFITSEKHFEECELQAKILTVSNKTTALGRLITGQVEKEGRIILSGPSDSAWLHSCIESMSDLNVDLTLVDGALSRMSLASPAITDAMILCTGAACSIQLEQLIKKVKYLCDLIALPQVDKNLAKICEPVQEGVWALTAKDTVNDFAINNSSTVAEFLAEKITNSLFLNVQSTNELLEKYTNFYVSGALTNNFLKMLTVEEKVAEIKLIVRDFSKIFVEPATFKRFIRRGGKIQVLQQAKLLSICTNPTSPEGYNYESELLRSSIQKELNIPVYDIMQQATA
jgi:hypothetical protein